MRTTDLCAGDLFGPYRLTGVLGRGGMGIVYSAIDTRTDQTVAVKMLPDDVAQDGAFRRRFVDEANAVRRLHHSNIVPILDSGKEDGTLFLVMPRIGGSDLTALLAEELTLDLERALRFTYQIADALAYAHSVGFVHRDVKPQNILIDGDDGAYLADFGLTRALDAVSRATLTGQLLGSLHYVAPEQIEGTDVDGRADVYSLGCVLYEMITGTVPFAREHDAAVLWAHMHAEVPNVTAVDPDVPPGVDDLLVTAMAKDRDDRYASMADLRDDVLALLSSNSPRYARARVAKLATEKLSAAEVALPVAPAKPRLRAAAGAVATLAITLSMFNLATRPALDVPPAASSVARSTDAIVRILPIPTGELAGDGRVTENDLVRKRPNRSAGSSLRGRTEQRPIVTMATDEPAAEQKGGTEGGRPLAAPAIPQAGNYEYKQSGEQELWERQQTDGTGIYSSALPPTAYQQITNTLRNGHVTAMSESQTETSSFSTLTRYEPTSIGGLTVEGQWIVNGLEFSIDLRAKDTVVWTPLPLRPGVQWRDEWQSSTAGVVKGKVLRFERVNAAGRSIKAARILSEMSFSGPSQGEIIMTSWIDPRTNVVLRSNGQITISGRSGNRTHPVDLRIRFQSVLKEGPGYR